MTQPPKIRGHDVVVMGGSSGSLEPMRQILGALPANLAAAVFVVFHLGPSELSPTVLFEGYSTLPVSVPEDGARILPGRLYIAPSDRHMALADGLVRVFHGPRENGSRPAIDTLFRSAAVHFGSRVVGVVLSGRLGDGSAGLSAVKRCGGTAIIQAPSDAWVDDMPRRALQATAVDHCVPAAEIAPLLRELVQLPAPEPRPVPRELRVEAHLASSFDERQVSAIGRPLQLVCPECSGALWQLESGPSAEHAYRCHVGHSFSPESMLTQQGLAVERALWVALRALEERGILLERMARDARTRGLVGIAENYEARIREHHRHASSIHRVLATHADILRAERGSNAS